MDFIKYGFHGLSQSFPQFNIVYKFLRYFFHNISQMMCRNICNISVQNKTTKMKRKQHN